MTTIITADQLDEISYIFDDASRGRHEDLTRNLSTSYSGRGMYGRCCLAYTGSAAGVTLFVLAVATVLTEDGTATDELLTDLASYSEDSMGRQQVYYWTGGAVQLDGPAAVVVDGG